MGYIKTSRTSAVRSHKKKGLLSKVLGAFAGFGDDATAADISSGGVPDADQTTSGTSSSSTTQDTTVLVGGQVVGGQYSGVPLAPVGSWKSVGGICYATTPDFAASVKTLQRQLNRVADAKSIALIGIDGSVGPATLSLMASVKALGAYAQVANSSLASCDAVCSNIYSFIAATQQYADGLSAPNSVSSPAPAAAPQIYNATTGQLQTQGMSASAADAWNNLSSMEQALLAGGAVVVGFWAYTEHKKQGKRRSRA